MISDEKLQKKIKWSPYSPKKHEKQIQIINSKARDIVVCAGRRGGKSATCAYIALKTLLENNRKIWIVAPTYDLSQKVFDYVIKWFVKAVPSQSHNIRMRPFPQIQTARGSKLECKSTENPAGLLGEELDLIIVDEAARISERVYNSYIYPTTTSRKGKTLFISTPFGKNWFYRKWLEVKGSSDGEVFHFASKDNPYFSEDEWERARNKLPEHIFKQEFQALFLEDAASVFRKVRDCIDGKLEEYNPRYTYLMGVDLGRYRDFTVIVVVNRDTRHVVHFERFKKIDWELQRGRIAAASNKYGKCPIWIDATAITIGDAFVQQLTDMGFSAFGYKIGGNVPKRQLVEKLSVLIDQRKISFPPIDVLVDELESFSLELSPSGNIRYQAPEGLFDDCVIALALACWELREFDYNNMIIRPEETKKGGYKEFLEEISLENILKPRTKHWLEH